MHTQILIQPINGFIEATVSAITYSGLVPSKEELAIKKLGALQLELGGTFNGVGNQAPIEVTFNMAACPAFFPTSFPHKRVFSVADLGSQEAMARAEVWAEAISKRVAAGLSVKVAEAQTLDVAVSSQPASGYAQPSDVSPELDASNWV